MKDLKELEQLYDTALNNYKVSKSDYDAGTVEGLKRAIEPGKENLKQHNFRMKDSEWIRLKDHFHKKGISIAGGLRMILIEYMEKEGMN